MYQVVVRLKLVANPRSRGSARKEGEGEEMRRDDGTAGGAGESLGGGVGAEGPLYCTSSLTWYRRTRKLSWRGEGDAMRE